MTIDTQLRRRSYWVARIVGTDHVGEGRTEAEAIGRALIIAWEADSGPVQLVRLPRGSCPIFRPAATETQTRMRIETMAQHTRTPGPASWDDVHECSCHFCRMLSAVRRDSDFCVFDCRAWGGGFAVANLHLLFERPCAVRARFVTAQQAAVWALYVLDLQRVHALIGDCAEWSGNTFVKTSAGWAVTALAVPDRQAPVVEQTP